MLFVPVFRGNRVMISAIVLAAGQSRRMGQPKQLLEWQGSTLLQHVLRNVIRSIADETILVLGYEAEQIGKTLSGLPVRIVVNPDYPSGMASSLQRGLLAMEPISEAFMFVLADQPDVGPDMINAVIRTFRQTGLKRRIVRPVYRGMPGHPILMSADYRQDLLQLKGDVGARQILSDHPEDITEIEVDRDAVLVDMDTPEDYRKSHPSQG